MGSLGGALGVDGTTPRTATAALLSVNAAPSAASTQDRETPMPRPYGDVASALPFNAKAPESDTYEPAHEPSNDATVASGVTSAAADTVKVKLAA